MTKIFNHPLTKNNIFIALAAIGAAIAISMFFVLTAGAHQSPATCTDNGIGISLGVFRADGATSIGGSDTVIPGELIKYRVTLSALGLPNCNFSGGTLTITTPDGVTNVTPGGGIPLVEVGSPFISAFVNYTVDSAEVGGDGDIDASASYTGGVSHNTNGQHDSASGSVTKQTLFEKLNPGIDTEVHNPNHTDITSSSVAYGTLVHDEVTLTASASGPTPSGTVDFTLYAGLFCNGSVVDSQSNIALNGSGVAESSDQSLLPGNYSYSVHYDGDDNYNEVTADCEPLTINKTNPQIVTEVHASPHVDITNSSVFEGTLVHDRVTVSGGAGIPAGTVDFALYSGLECLGQAISTEDNVQLNGSGVAESTPTAPADGQYSYSVHYDGDSTYNEATAQCEPFTINPVEPLIIEKTAETTYDRQWNWDIRKSANQTSLLLAEGQSFTVNYEIEASASSEDINHQISGIVTITNPQGNPDVTVTSVTDELDFSGSVTLVCDQEAPVVLSGGESINCTYSENVSGKDDAENEVVVETDGAVPGGSDTADVNWGVPDEVIDECINITDTYSEGPQGVQVCAGDGDDEESFSYAVTFGPEGDQEVDVPVVCGENNHLNTVSFITNNTGAQGQDNWNVHIIVKCDEGCTLTQGYWKTHSEHGPAPYDDNWANLSVGADTLFLNLTSVTWYKLFWMPPSGGNAFIQLAHQWMAATLNVLNGASTTPAVDAALAGAEDLLDNYTNIPAAKSISKALQQQMRGYAGTLGSYNEGLIGPGHCDEQNP